MAWSVQIRLSGLKVGRAGKPTWRITVAETIAAVAGILLAQEHDFIR